MNSTKQRVGASNLIAGVLGGLVVLVLGAILIETDVIDTGDSTTRVVRQAPISQTATDPAAAQSGKTVQDIYRQEGRGVVFIQSEGVTGGENAFGEQQQGTATGSGFVVDKDGTIITNAHVVDGASKVTVSFEEGGDAIDAAVKGVDDDADIAVLKINPEGRDLTVLPLGDSSQLSVGDPVVAIGNPFGLQRTVTTGIVSALQRQVDAPSGFPISDVIQTDASINPGNSGGPLLDMNGKVIGVNSAIARIPGTSTDSTGGNIGVGFAIPSDQAAKTAQQLITTGKADHPALGVQVDRSYTGDGAKLASGGVQAGSAAAQAGLKEGDVITEFEGKRVTDADALIVAIRARSVGDTVSMKVQRGNQTVDVRMTLQSASS